MWTSPLVLDEGLRIRHGDLAAAVFLLLPLRGRASPDEHGGDALAARIVEANAFPKVHGNHALQDRGGAAQLTDYALYY
jgi:hypothetical protein